MTANRWIILTGEYPPQNGGVSDYTELVAHGLASQGDLVDIWAPPAPPANKCHPGVVVNRLPDHFGLLSLAILSKTLKEMPDSTRILVQYVPHAYGQKAMNVGFCFWLWRNRRRNITIMFHEVAYPWVVRPLIMHHNLIAATNRLMVHLLVKSASRLYVAIPAWERLLGKSRTHPRVEWLPVPSNISPEAEATCTPILKTNLAPHAGMRIIGHFGTFREGIASRLRTVVQQLLRADDGIFMLLLGRGSREFAETIGRDCVAGNPRVLATGELEPGALAQHLSTCELLVQPYPDGISSRRTGAMAGLACGVPILTTSGALTDPIWKSSGAVCLVDSVEDLAARALQLLANPSELDELRANGLALYRSRFHIDRTVAALRS